MEPLEMHRRADAEFARVLDKVNVDDSTSATPCDDWTVDDLIEHRDAAFLGRVVR